MIRRRLYRMLLMPVLMAQAFSACTFVDQAIDDSSENSPLGVTDSVAVGLGVSFEKGHTGQTRMSANATQTNGTFRGISDFFLIPYATEGVIGPNDVPLKKNIELGRYISETRLINNNNAAFYKPVYVPRKTASFLIFGHAPAGADPFTYGSLSGFEDIENHTKPSDITFSLNPIYTETGIPTVAQELADFLTGIATIRYELPEGYYGDIFYRVLRHPVYVWSNPDSYEHEGLADAFSLLSNDDRVMGGSSQNVSCLLTALYNRLYLVATSDPTAVSYYVSSNAPTPVGTIYPYRELAKAIRTAINNSDFVQLSGYGSNVTVSLKTPRNQYPTSLKLPDGAAAIQWNADAQQFQVVLQTKASAKVLSASRICYPPLLCYYGNSRIKTSDTDSEQEHYVPSNSWSQILDEYQNSSAVVNSKTQSIAIKDAINYGVAQLRVCIKSPLILHDRGNMHEISVTGTNFPLTALIVGPQYDVAYNFDPLASSDEHTVYDPRIIDEENKTIYLLPYNVATAYANTLVLPTRKDEVIYLILEFENNSGVDFNGANGVILNGSKFYMTAKLDPAKATGYDADDNTLNRVFSQDGYTEVTCVVSDLKGAWNVVPDTRDPQLEIGVSMEMKWTHSTTTNVLLD